MAEASLLFYKSAVGESFQVLGTEPLFELELIQVDDRGQAGGFEQFALVFRGPEALFLPQQTVMLRHPEIEDETVFVVPIGKDTDGYRYEAVYSRQVQA
ncbi:DUF6916 family protein [Paenibacillus sp. NPDC058174]|uniref:DUF6916 family protein n=1 Tax=Paenibacillus sp. NPDC058174 TaxID=3346366 RepID=UPI0036DCBCC1